MLKDLMLENIIYQKVWSRIIMWSWMENNLFDQPSDSDIKRYKEISKC